MVTEAVIAGKDDRGVKTLEDAFTKHALECLHEGLKQAKEQWQKGTTNG
jgi:hypothetical protein